jgi:hypothetical protein
MGPRLRRRESSGRRRRPALAPGAGGLLAAALGALAAGCGASETAAPAPVAAQPRAPVEATTTVDRAVATTGDVITYTVSVEHDPELEIDLPEPGAEIAGFRIFDLGREAPSDRGGRRVESRWYKLRADIVGSYVLPPVQVGFRPPGSAEAWQTIETSAIFVEVESVLPADGEAADIRALKPLREVRRGPPWPWIAAGLTALALATIGLWLWSRRPRPAAPLVPPHVLAFSELDALRGTDFEDPAAVRRFHFRISEVIRTYVEGRWGLNATDLTTEEILPQLAGLAELPADEAVRLSRFLRATDRVKFAEHRPRPSEVAETWEQALGFVEATCPRPEPDEAAAEPAREAA